MDDEELEKLREKKKREAREESLQEQQEQQREQVKQLAAQYLTKDARSRLGNIRAAKPELASALESQVVRLGRSGQVKKINDDQLKEILRSLKGDGNDTDIKFRR